MMRLRAVDPWGSSPDCAMLYEMMTERLDEPHTNISHLSVPSWVDHMAFMRTGPYMAWFIVLKDGCCAGSTYLTRRREIGLYLRKDFRGRGIGREVVAEMRARFPGPILANVNPLNADACQFWDRMGGKLLQVTYAL
jgi:RimJ/RimL family protein N-acetyltransferase